MPTTYVRQLFVGGLNGDIPPIAVDLNSQQPTVIEQVSAVVNGTFERGCLYARAGMVNPDSQAATLSSTQTVLALEGLPFVAGAGALGAKGLLGLTKTAAPLFQLYYFCTDAGAGHIFAPTEITGPGIPNNWDDFFFSVGITNGAVLIGGHNGGLIRWVPSGAVYTQIAGAPYRFVTSMYSRSVAAYKLTGALTDPLTVAWSVAGDETDWASYGSGATVLADIPDQITGLTVIRNVLVIARPFGFHLGMPTGIYPTVFNFSSFAGNCGIGNAFPSTLRVFDNVAYFVSNTGIHTFDLTKIEEIGEGIYADLLATAQAWGGTLKSFISRSYKQDNQPCYNLYIDQTDSTSSYAIAMYQYNIREKKWSKHIYHGGGSPGYSTLFFAGDYKPQTAFATTGPPLAQIGALARPTGVAPVFRVCLQSSNTPLGLPVSQETLQFSTGNIVLAAPFTDAMLSRIMIVYGCHLDVGQLYATPPTISVTVYYTLDGVTSAATKTINPSLSSTTATPSYVWDRRWLDVRVAGNAFSCVFGIIGDVVVKEVLMEFTTEGRTR